MLLSQLKRNVRQALKDDAEKKIYFNLSYSVNHGLERIIPSIIAIDGIISQKFEQS